MAHWTIECGLSKRVWTVKVIAVLIASNKTEMVVNKINKRDVSEFAWKSKEVNWETLKPKRWERNRWIFPVVTDFKDMVSHPIPGSRPSGQVEREVEMSNFCPFPVSFVQYTPWLCPLSGLPHRANFGFPRHFTSFPVLYLELRMFFKRRGNIIALSKIISSRSRRVNFLMPQAIHNLGN